MAYCNLIPPSSHFITNIDSYRHQPAHPPTLARPLIVLTSHLTPHTSHLATSIIHHDNDLSPRSARTMVQYILTPWRDRRELLMVRRQFYGRDPYPETTTQPETLQRAGERPQRRDPRQPRREADQRSEAVARVGMWIQRGNCPHMVESTMALMAAVLVDEKQGRSSEEQYGLRCQYANAFARYGYSLRSKTPC